MVSHCKTDLCFHGNGNLNGDHHALVCTAVALTKFLNSWSRFERDLELAFPKATFKYCFEGIGKTRDNLLLYYVAYPSIIIYPNFLAAFCFNLGITAKVLVTCMFIQIAIVSLSEDALLLLSYKTICESFAQVDPNNYQYLHFILEGFLTIMQTNFEVHKCMVRYHELKRLLTVPTAQCWRHLVLGVRQRVHQLGECNKYAELNRLMGTLANVTLGLYVILSGWDRVAKKGQMLFCMVMLGYIIILAGRTYLKAMMAEWIT